MQLKKAENLREESPRSSVNEGISTVLYKVTWRWIESGTIAEEFIESDSLAHRLSTWTLGPILQVVFIRMLTRLFKRFAMTSGGQVHAAIWDRTWNAFSLPSIHLICIIGISR